MVQSAGELNAKWSCHNATEVPSDHVDCRGVFWLYPDSAKKLLGMERLAPLPLTGVERWMAMPPVFIFLRGHSSFFGVRASFSPFGKSKGVTPRHDPTSGLRRVKRRPDPTSAPHP